MRRDTLDNPIARGDFNNKSLRGELVMGDHSFMTNCLRSNFAFPLLHNTQTTITFLRKHPTFKMSYPMYPTGPQSGFIDPAGYPINPSVPSPQPLD